MQKKIRNKKALSILLTLCLAAGCVGGIAGASEFSETVLAEETEGLSSGEEEMVLLGASADACRHGNVADECGICEVEELIDALPTLSEISAMGSDAQLEVYAEASDICDAYYELAEEEQEQVSNIDTLWDILDYFNGGISLSTMSTTVGSFIVEGGTNGTDYSYSSNTLYIKTSTALTISTSSQTSDHIYVESGVEANITLAGVNIKTSGSSQWSACPLYMGVAGESTITLAEGTTNTLDASSTTDYGPGIYVPANQQLTITGTGELIAKGGQYWPGIGGQYAYGKILIESGTVTANGGNSGAGIGGSYGHYGGSITISGGTVNATGGSNGAGIGGGRDSSTGSAIGTTITISGGTVTAAGGSGGAGIGCGSNGNTNTSISISGGYISAAGGGSAKAIGGYTSSFGTITGGYFGTGDISAGTVYGVTVAEGVKVSESGISDYPYVVTGGPYTITLNISNGSLNNWSITSYEYGDTVTLPTADDIICTEGYVFVGWYENSDFSGTAVTAISATDIGDKIYYAKIIKSSQIVTFDSNGGGTVDPETITVSYGSTYGKLPTPEYTGYKFMGWYTEADGGTEVTESTTVSAEGDHTLYAHWNCSHSECNEDGFCENCGYYEPAEWNSNGAYYEISNPGQLLWFGALVNSDDSNADFEDEDLVRGASADAVLTADIDMNSYGAYYVPIGRVATLYNTVSGTGSISAWGYQGTFDGQGYEIRNLTISTVTSYDIGIFGTLSGTVKNLGVYNFNNSAATEDARGGALAGQILLGGIAENCYVQSSNINCPSRVAGGLAGANYGGTVKNCYVVDTTGTATRFGYLIGDNKNDNSASVFNGTVINCYTDKSSGNIGQTATTDDVNYKTVAEFASGEVAHLLQNGQSDNSVLAWGQSLSGTTDNNPVLTLTESLRVLKVTFYSVTAGSALKTVYINNGLAYDSYPEAETGFEYVFYADEDCTDANKIDTSNYIYEVGNTTDNAITIYVKQIKSTYTITFVLEYGSVTAGNTITYEYGDGATLPTADDITDNGYTFLGWYTSADYEGNIVTEVSASEYGDKTFYGKMVKSTQVVTLDADGGTCAASIEVTYGGTYSSLPAPTMDGYTFAGWYMEDGTLITGSTTVTTLDDHTLYAKWIFCEYIVAHENGSCTYSDNVLEITSGGTYAISLNSYAGVNEATADRVKVNTSEAVTIILTDVTAANSGASPFEISGTGEVTLVLSGTNSLTSTADGCAGLQNGSSSTLIITSDEGTGSDSGSLTATGGSYGAGIGGGNGSITIEGGTITAQGGSDSAGIGGSSGNSGGTITIEGGMITATGGSSGGAGIGGGGDGSGGTITVNGGTVTAIGSGNSYIKGSYGGAGIGGGRNGSGGTITITGGTVMAQGGGCAHTGQTSQSGAGIGGGSCGNGGTIAITGGTITAIGGEGNRSKGGAGIGSGGQGIGGTVEISGGMVTATGGDVGAGIGSSYNTAYGTIIISGDAVVEATGGSNAAGIGGGSQSKGGTITISGNTEVTATGGTDSAGIGGGQNSSGTATDAITINSGTVTATGNGSGAGIGCGSSGTITAITIIGGTVMATGGNNGAGFGGSNASQSGTITISGGFILAESESYDPIGGGSGGFTGTITITGGYFGEGDTDAETVYSVMVDTVSGYIVYDNPYIETNSTWPYLVDLGGSMFTVALSVSGGTVKADSDVTEYISGTGTALPTSLDDFEYTGECVFDGWYTSSDYTGSKVTSITSSDYGDMTLYARLYSVPTYTVTIPETAELGSTATVSADNVTLADGTSLVVRLTGASGTDNALTVTSNNGTGMDSLSYTLSINGGSAISVAGNNPILTIESGTIEGSGSATLAFSDPLDVAKFSGTYKGTLTFTVSVEDN